jgi:hypothetical protein
VGLCGFVAFWLEVRKQALVCARDDIDKGHPGKKLDGVLIPRILLDLLEVVQVWEGCVWEDTKGIIREPQKQR